MASKLVKSTTRKPMLKLVAAIPKGNLVVPSQSPSFSKVNTSPKASSSR